jgi:hypothetical protein
VGLVGNPVSSLGCYRYAPCSLLLWFTRTCCHWIKTSRAIFTEIRGSVSTLFHNLSFRRFYMHQRVITKSKSWWCCRDSSNLKKRATKPSAVSKLSCIMFQRPTALQTSSNFAHPKKTCQSFSYELSECTHQSHTFCEAISLWFFLLKIWCGEDHINILYEIWDILKEYKI